MPEARIFLRDHFRRAQAVHVFAEQRMMINCVAQLHGVLELPLHKLETLQRRLPATKIKRGQDLVVGRCGGMRHVRLAEALGHLQREVLIVNVDHRPLAKRGQRLVRRLSRIDPDASSRGIRAQAVA